MTKLEKRIRRLKDKLVDAEMDLLEAKQKAKDRAYGKQLVMK